jgi:GAF domain-containing protein
VGMLVCAWWTVRRRPSRDELRVVKGIAAQAAMAIVNAQHFARATRTAIDAERVRVDNLLHDTLRRTLFAVALRIERCLTPRQPSAALRSIVRQIKADVGLMMTQVNGVIPADLEDAT